KALEDAAEAQRKEAQAAEELAATQKHLQEEVSRAGRENLSLRQRVESDEFAELNRLREKNQLNETTLALVHQIYGAELVHEFNAALRESENQIRAVDEELRKTLVPLKGVDLARMGWADIRPVTVTPKDDFRKLTDRSIEIDDESFKERRRHDSAMLAAANE